MRRKKSKYKLKRLARDRELWSRYGLKKPAKPRYTGLQGVLWYLVSRNVRRQEFALYGGKCVDCGRTIESWQKGHCGHFQGAGKASTRFLRQNLALQHPNCNLDQKNGDAVQFLFGKEIDRRYGEGTAENIIAQSKIPKVLTNEWLEAEIQKELLCG